MATKTITITKDSYKLLVAKKSEDESFSEEIKRLLLRRAALHDFFGILGEDGKNIANDFQSLRKHQLRQLTGRTN